MAYFFGVFFGKTPLIKLSPKKTWEGFIGASFSTVLSAFMVILFNAYNLCWFMLVWCCSDTIRCSWNSCMRLFLHRLSIMGSPYLLALSWMTTRLWKGHRMASRTDQKIAFLSLCLQLAYIMGQSEWLTCPRKVCSMLPFLIMSLSILHFIHICQDTIQCQIYLFSWVLKDLSDILWW